MTPAHRGGEELAARPPPHAARYTHTRADSLSDDLHTLTQLTGRRPTPFATRSSLTRHISSRPCVLSDHSPLIQIIHTTSHARIRRCRTPASRPVLSPAHKSSRRHTLSTSMPWRVRPPDPIVPPESIEISSSRPSRQRGRPPSFSARPAASSPPPPPRSLLSSPTSGAACMPRISQVVHLP